MVALVVVAARGFGCAAPLLMLAQKAERRWWEERGLYCCSAA